MENEKPITKKMKILIPTTKIKKSVKCKNTKQAYHIFRDLIDYEKYELKDQEHFWIMGIDSEEYVACVYIAAIGSENRYIIDPIDMFATAVNHKSRKIVLAHNHPDVYDDLNLSIADYDLTNRLYHACLPFGMEILDHIILADGTYYSFLENGYMEMIYESLKYKTYDDIEPIIEEEKKDYGDAKKIEGMIEGIKEGKSKGIEIGIDKGEHNKAVEMAKNLLKLNLSIEDIIKVTGFTKEEIEELM